jgi:hypothetical protein
MTQTVVIDVGGGEVQFELSPTEAPPLSAATGEASTLKALKSFEQSIASFAALARRFGEAFIGAPVSSAEISMGLKVTAKGDFIVVGTTGEATLNLKLTLVPPKAS